MSAEDPYRWAKTLLAEGSTREQAVVTLSEPEVAGTLIVVGALCIWDGLRGKR